MCGMNNSARSLRDERAADDREVSMSGGRPGGQGRETAGGADEPGWFGESAEPGARRGSAEIAPPQRVAVFGGAGVRTAPVNVAQRLSLGDAISVAYRRPQRRAAIGVSVAIRRGTHVMRFRGRTRTGTASRAGRPNRNVVAALAEVRRGRPRRQRGVAKFLHVAVAAAGESAPTDPRPPARRARDAARRSPRTPVVRIDQRQIPEPLPGRVRTPGAVILIRVAGLL
jgi:hypothetical protein